MAFEYFFTSRLGSLFSSSPLKELDEMLLAFLNFSNLSSSLTFLKGEVLVSTLLISGCGEPMPKADSTLSMELEAVKQLTVVLSSCKLRESKSILSIFFAEIRPLPFPELVLLQ